ncbi:hypothetical protein Q3Y86_001663 [Salmonella enterica]|nr:hypothetical protein [Salmonella enterica]ECD7631112.1 hypothetical protein [Salmonella enterica subsp. enterica serovar Poona]EHZ8575039.1 hypothetical protein [Salmonella enterica]EIB7828102.1 hypothetical protein [Salmonella enterica]ELD8088689.1 hypothetical protein [Salmonella enterica]
MVKRSEIKFIRPCLSIYENNKVLTPAYALQCLTLKKVIQINLDNCSLQRMEELSSTSTLEDVKRVGLLPLVDLLQSGSVCLTAIGVNEMPDIWVEKSMAAYQNFCHQFWPSHIDDPEATFRDYSPDAKEKKVLFQELSAEARTVYGLHYISMLQIQNIKLNYSHLTPEKRFEVYLYSMISFIDMISAYDLEIAKYAFWDLDSNAINQLPESIHTRRKYIKENFYKNGSNLDKWRWYAFDAAMDLHWLTGANFSEDIGSFITLNGVKFETEHWVGTNDKKLYYISQDIHHIYYEGSTMKALSSCRENEMTAFQYWKVVDSISQSVLLSRKYSKKEPNPNITKLIDLAVEKIENDLHNYFLTKDT